MYDTGKFVFVIVLFLAVCATPFLLASKTAGTVESLKLELPEDEEYCVREVAYMRANHMTLLNDWRDEVVRDGDRKHVGPGNKTYDKSLTDTCLGCHKKKNFCDKCHEYTNVKPFCWTCHVVPGEENL